MKQFLKQTIYLSLLLVVIFSLPTFAYNIEDVSEFLTATNKRDKAKELTWVKVDDPDAIEDGYIYGISGTISSNTWVKYGQDYYFITETGNKVGKVTPIFYVTKDTVAIGYENKFTIYSFDANGASTADNTGIVYDGFGNKITNDKANSIPVYKNYTGWYKNGDSWYYYTDSTHVLADGYAILPSGTEASTKYNLFRFNNKGKCNSNKTNGLLKDGTVEGVKAQITSSYNGCTTILAKVKNTGFNSNAKNLEVESNISTDTTNSNTAFKKLLNNYYNNGANYSNENGGWKVYSTYYRYYTDNHTYLKNGFAIVANDENESSYSLYEFGMDGLAALKGYTGTLEDLEQITTTTKYTEATETEDKEMGSTTGKEASNLDICTDWGWKKENDHWRYYENDVFLYSGYAIVPEDTAKTIYAIYYFDANGYGQKIKQGSLSDMENDTGSYEPAQWKAPEDEPEEQEYESNIYDLEVYEDYNGWEQDGSNWKYFVSDGEYLVSGYAIITNDDTNSQYGLFKFSNTGNYSREGDLKSSVLAVQNTYNNKSYTPAYSSNGEETSRINNNNDRDGDNYSEKEDDYEIYDDGTFVKNGKVYVNGKQYSDSEFLAVLNSLSNIQSNNTPGTATALALIPAGKAEDVKETPEPDEPIENQMDEVEISQLPQLLTFENWKGNTYEQNNKKAILGYAIVKWTGGEQGNQYCLAEFDVNGNVTQKSELKVSVKKVIEDETIPSDSFQPIMWGNK